MTCREARSFAKEESGMKGIYKCKINNYHRIGDDLYLLSLRLSGRVAVKPGQFFMLRVREGSEPLLGRPLSWFRYFPNRRILEFAFQVMGKGTEILSRRREGGDLSIIGPLGNGFETKGLRGRVLLVAGGMGMAGLWSLAEALGRNPNCAVELVWGVKSKSRFFLLKELSKRFKVHPATEDGSLGKAGLATELVKELIDQEGLPEHIFACGPKPMLKSLSKPALSKKIPGQVLYEERMACGVGACLGCAVPASGGGYLHACLDGPALRFDQIDWERVRC